MCADLVCCLPVVVTGTPYPGMRQYVSLTCQLARVKTLTSDTHSHTHTQCVSIDSIILPTNYVGRGVNVSSNLACVSHDGSCAQ